MHLTSLLLSFLIVVTPPSTFSCEGESLDAIIYNNLNGDYQITNDLEDIDVGAFVVLKCRGLNIMIPRTFNAGEISFSDRKWWWSYQDRDHALDVEHPRFRQVLERGEIQDYRCEMSMERGEVIEDTSLEF